MITREQFEAHVRAEAERRFPYKENRPHGQGVRRQRIAYIERAMEHELRLLNAGNAMAKFIRDKFDEAEIMAEAKVVSDWTAATSTYTTKPIER